MNPLLRLLDAFGARLIAWGAVLRRSGNAPDAEGAEPLGPEDEPFDAKQYWLERTAHVPPQAWRREARQRASPSSLPPRDARPVAADTPRHRVETQTRVPPALVVAAERETRAPSVARGAGAPAASGRTGDAARHAERSAGARPERSASVPRREPADTTAITNRFAPASALSAAAEDAALPKRSLSDEDTPSRRAAAPAAASAPEHLAASAPTLTPAPIPRRPWSSRTRGPEAAPRRDDSFIEPMPSSAPPVAHRADVLAPVDHDRPVTPFAPPRVEGIERPAEREVATLSIAPPPVAAPEGAATFEPLDRSRLAAQRQVPVLRSAPWSRATLPERRRPDRFDAPAPQWPDLPPWPDPTDAARRVPDPHTLQRRQRLELEQRG